MYHNRKTSKDETLRSKNETKPTVRIAIIGAGIIGLRHAQSVSVNSFAELVAFVDIDPYAKDIAESMGTKYFDSIVSLLGKDKPDAAIVCTPSNTHVSIAKTLLSAKVHVLVEKPIATDITSGLSLLRLHASLALDRVHLLVGHHRRFSPYVWKAKEVIDSGALGTIIGVNGLWTAFKPESYFNDPTEWRRQKETGGGVILTDLIHEIDLMQFLVGPITKVYAEPSTPHRQNPDHTAEEGGAITLRFDSGAVGSFMISDTTPSPFNFESGTGENPLVPHSGQDFMRIFGSDATLSLPDMHLWSYYGQKQKDWAQSLTVSKLETLRMTSFDFQVQHLVDVVSGESEPLINGWEAMTAVAVCDAILKSMERAVPVEVERLKGMTEPGMPLAKL
ncbi:hypothetical protein KEM54_001435 [Ascosphaera aggregata]|nr:hypothetical protein KEM54_001435 [Ascosphaera aggregata]